MRPAVQIASCLALLAALGGGAWWLQSVGSRHRPDRAPDASPPSPAAEMIVAGLGGFRGLVAEAIWFRADRLQDEGRYGELAQLASWLTFLEPRTPEVWAYSAWNLAYNISVMMPTAADRWRWVEAGIRLLRDDGLSLNPSDPVLHKELAWMFLLKLGTETDAAASHYRVEWKRKIEAAQASGDWRELKLAPATMSAVDAEYGRQDWTSPYASALYWAYEGLRRTTRPDMRRELRQIVYQSLMMEARLDERVAPRALAEMESAYREFPNPMLEKLIENFKGARGF